MLALLAVAAAIHHCPAASVGPGSLHRGGTAGAACLLASFQNGCRSADYTLSAFGIDTIRSAKFRTRSTSGGCRLVVTESFRVVPQPLRVVRHLTCTQVRKLNGDIVADRCAPKGAVSLTKLSP